VALFLSIKNIFFLLILTFIVFACNKSESYLFTQQSNLRIIERQDHQRCVAQGLDFGHWDEIVTELYWRCRYNLLQRRKINDDVSGKTIRHNAMIKKMGEEMLQNLSRARYSALAQVEEDVELSDHNKCLKMGHNFGIGHKDENYYLCRQNLILSRIPPAPKVTNAFESVILDEERSKQNLQNAAKDRKSVKEAAFALKMMQEYPICVGLNIKSADFRKCANATDESHQCNAGIRLKVVEKQLKNKKYCQNQAFVQFPDNFAQRKQKSANQINLEQKDDEDKANKNEEENIALLYLESGGAIKSIVQKPKVKKITDGGIGEYNRIDLLRLREQFIVKCNENMAEKMTSFAQEVADECMQISKDWYKKSD
jgi:hypothetical protein